MDQDVVGLSEIAKLAGVTPAAVSNWRKRFPDFPEPVKKLGAGPIFDGHQVRRWLRQHKGVHMAHVVSFINLKGGVGKTTACVAVAEMLATDWRHGQKVLVIDLDPQTNATTMLIGEDRWEQARKKGHTLATLFGDALEDDPSNRTFDLDSTLIRDASGVTGEYGAASPGSVDLLPSSLDLIDIQDRLALMTSGRFYSNVPTEILRRAIKPIIDEYDWVLIDCPPNLGIITLNGLRISDGFVIPTVPDHLSTYGIPQILTRAAAFAENVGEAIEPLGVIISKYRETALHQDTVRQLRKNESKLHVFETKIPERTATASAAEHYPEQTFRQRYGYDGNYDTFKAIARELRELVGDLEPVA